MKNFQWFEKKKHKKIKFFVVVVWMRTQCEWPIEKWNGGGMDNQPNRERESGGWF